MNEKKITTTPLNQKQRVLALAQKKLDATLAELEALSSAPSVAKLDELVHIFHTVRTIQTGK